MEGTNPDDKIENLQTPETNGSKLKMERKDGNRSCASGSRRMRSQVAPDWTVKDALLLVNEIAAVEADCSNALSSYQKWKIISENCTALDVPRSLNQCRREWDSLLVVYNQIKQWDAWFRNDSYWSLEIERRKECGLPETFDVELFKAIDNVVRAHEDKADTDPDSDPEAEADMLELIAELGSKRPRRRLNGAEDKPHKIRKEEKPQKSRAEEKPQESCTEEILQKSPVEQKLQKCRVDEKKPISIEEKEQMMAAKLRENADRIHAIVKGNDEVDHRAPDLKNAEDFKTDLARRQGDQLIACLGNIVNTLDQFCDFVRECE